VQDSDQSDTNVVVDDDVDDTHSNARGLSPASRNREGPQVEDRRYTNKYVRLFEKCIAVALAAIMNCRMVLFNKYSVRTGSINAIMPAG